MSHFGAAGAAPLKQVGYAVGMASAWLRGHAASLPEQPTKTRRTANPFMETTLSAVRKAAPGRSPSWSSLIATTLGLDDFGRLHAIVRASVPNLENCRLVVQAYALSAMTGSLPGLYARPLAAAQRAISAEELKRGASVVLVHSDAAQSQQGCVVVAWVEAGHPDLDYDGLCARPSGAAFVGTTFASCEHAEVVLERAAAWARPHAEPRAAPIP